jgi:uncharacterized protein
MNSLSGRGRRVFGWIATLVLGWVLLVSAMLLLERRFIYFPAAALVASPATYGLEADDVWMEAEDGTRVHGWWLHSGGERALIWCHGNAGNISHRLENARRLVDALGMDILLFDYRGYGLSGGRPDEQGLYLDSVAAYGEARRRGFEPAQIVLFGRSLGAAVATELARRRPAAALILESPFLSIPAMARAVYPFVPSFLVRTQFDNEAKIGRLDVPILIIHGARDEIVPLAHGRRLYEAAAPPKRFFEIPGAGHNDTYIVGGQEYLEVWRSFLNARDP